MSERAAGEAISVDIGSWPQVGTGVTQDGWELDGIDAYADGITRFDTKDDCAVSPAYSGFVTQVVMRVRASSSDVTCLLTLVPETASASASEFAAAATTKLTDQTFAWPASDEVRRLRLANRGRGPAGWGVRSLTIWLDRVEPPNGRDEETFYSDALPVRWTPDPRAVSHEVEVDRVVTVLPSYRQLARWDFSVLTNATGNPKSFPDIDGAETLSGVSGDTLNVQKRSGGYLQVGNTDNWGSLALELPDGGSRSALLKMYRSSGDGTDGEVFVSGIGADGATNVIFRPWLTTMAREYVSAVPDDIRRIVLRSPFKNRRIRIEDARIAADYAPGSVTTNLVGRCRTVRNDCVAKGLEPGDWLWRVRSFDRRGFDSPWSAFRYVTLKKGSPPLVRHGCLILVR